MTRTDRRYIRDTVSNDWAPSWKPDLDKRMAWLDKVADEIAIAEMEKELWESIAA